MRQAETILLREGNSGLPFAATLIQGVTLVEMQAADQQWKPFLTQAVEEALARGVSRYDLPDNKHWEWERKARAMGAESLAFSIEADHETQALMIVRTDKICRLPQQMGKPMVYVDYLATAPWNLSELVPAPRYKSCGRRMVQAAIRYSASLGFDGRIGLHSLYGAEGFYRSGLRMQDCGIDVHYEDLRYFEMTEVIAREIASGV
jgi:hypothetical protein